MNFKRMPTISMVTGVLAVPGCLAIAAQDKYTVKVTNGLALSEFRGYEAWQVVSISQNGSFMAATLANPVMINAYLAGVPSNGKPFPDVRQDGEDPLEPEKVETFPAATVPGTQHDVDFMVKDSKRFADSGGWAVFEYDAASDTFRPGTPADKPPSAQGIQQQDQIRGGRIWRRPWRDFDPHGGVYFWKRRDEVEAARTGATAAAGNGFPRQLQESHSGKSDLGEAPHSRPAFGRSTAVIATELFAIPACAHVSPET